MFNTPTQFPTFQPTGFSEKIFRQRYALTETETWEEACRRVSRQMGMAEESEKMKSYEDKFFDILYSNLFVPGGRIWFNSGKNNPALLNCFVLGDDLDSKEGWGTVSYEMIVTTMSGGGCGINFSDVRPRGAPIKKGVGGNCPGPVSLMELINGNAEPVRAGGGRRAALMFSLDLEHPDIEEFLDAKLEKGKLSLANVSVRIQEMVKFIDAVKKDEEIELSWKGQYKKKIKAKDLWTKIVTNAYNSAEPGILNWELVEAESTISYLTKLSSTNPCLPADTWINTTGGMYHNRKQILDLIGVPFSVTFNGKNYNSTGFWFSGVKQCYKIETSKGYNIEATENHQFKIKRNNEEVWETTHNLLSGDNMILANGGESEITNIYPTEKKAVFDCNVEDIHYFDANGFISHNCGEIPMQAYSTCCLGHLVLPRFVKNGKMNFELLGYAARLGVRFLDNVLTVNTFPIEQMKKVSSNTRRIGMGVTGLADMLILVGLKYGSPEANEFLDRLFRFISKNAYEASVLLAIEKGPFPACIPSKHIETGFVKRMTPKVKQLILEHGIRNCAILTIAPTGTVSILSNNCSSGIEPIFSAAYERRYWVGNERQKETVFHPLFKEYMEDQKNLDNFISSREISVKDHMEVQKIIQRHIDNAISKTIHIPEDYPIDRLSDNWLEYLPFLKGTTFYRENTRGYVDDAGKMHEPPLVALTLEEAQEKFLLTPNTINKIVGVGEDKNCKDGFCDIG